MKSKNLRLKVALSNLDRGLVVGEDASDAEFRNAACELSGRALRRLGGSANASDVGEHIIANWTPDPNTNGDPVQHIAAMLSAGNYAEGTMLAELLLSVDPDNTGLLFNLGMALSDRRKLDRAIFLLRRAIEIEPVSSDAQVALAVALERSGNTDSAIQQLLHAIEVDPSNS